MDLPYRTELCGDEAWMSISAAEKKGGGGGKMGNVL